MSSDDDLHDIDDSFTGVGDSAKRRKVLRACDVCRRKKIRCDAHSMPNTRCTHCVTYKLDCTFVENAKKRGPPKGYIDDLEKRCQDLEALVSRVAPQVNLDDEVGPGFTKDSWATIKGPTRPRRASQQQARSASKKLSPPLPESPPLSASCYPLAHTGLPLDELSGPVEPITLDVVSAFNSDDESSARRHAELTRHIEREMEEMNINTGFEKRFHGKSSGVTLIQVAMDLKEEVVGDSKKNGNRKIFPLRAKFWQPNPWEWMTGNLPSIEDLHFPPEDLAPELIDHCFEKALVLFPVLHRPTFEKQVKEQQYKKDIYFARVYLLVCSVGSRYTDDTRVCLKNPKTGETEWNSAGWRYFAQVMSMKRPLLAPVGLSDLQCAALMSLYLQGTSAPHAAWLIVGLGLRFAQDIGAHREKVYGPNHPFENQMWKRAFWSLVALDRMASTGLGRPIAVFDEDIDADLPLEVDDEYWDPVKKQWKQPEGKPSKLSGFCHYIRLVGILAYAIRTVYSINKSKVHLGFVGPEWESHTVAELDSALNSWLDGLPDYLRWDPTVEDSSRLHQAAALRLTYHYVQITIHRPFIPILTGRSSSLSFPSLAICTNAARSTSHVLEAYSACGVDTTSVTHLMAFTAGTVLLISIWGVKKSKLNVDVSSQIADVHRCIKVLQKAEKRWHSAGRLCDILTELASMNDLPLPLSTPTPPDTTRKRERDDDGLVDSTGSSTYYTSPSLPHSSYSEGGSPLFPQATPSATYVSPQRKQFASPNMNIGTQQPSKSRSVESLNSGTLPWGVPSQNQSSNDLGATGATQLWDMYHIGGADIPGMSANPIKPADPGVPNASFQDVLSPYTLFQGLFNTFQNPSPQPPDRPLQQQQAAAELWNMRGPESEFGWLNDMGMYGLTPSAPPGSNTQ